MAGVHHPLAEAGVAPPPDSVPVVVLTPVIVPVARRPNRATAVVAAMAKMLPAPTALVLAVPDVVTLHEVGPLATSPTRADPAAIDTMPIEPAATVLIVAEPTTDADDAAAPAAMLFTRAEPLHDPETRQLPDSL